MTYNATKRSADVSGLPHSVTPITPNDSTDLAVYSRILVTVAGNLAVHPANATLSGDTPSGTDAPIVITAAPVGFQIPFAVRRVMLTGTSATVVALGKTY